MQAPVKDAARQAVGFQDCREAQNSDLINEAVETGLFAPQDKKCWLIPGSGVMKTDAAATRKGAASK